MTTRSMTQGALVLSAIALGLSGGGCGQGDEGPSEVLIYDLQVLEHHFHSFETEAHFTALATDLAGDLVRDFSILRVEIGPAGHEHWQQQVPLFFDGERYAGSTRFTAAGSYDVRLMGQRPEQLEPAERERLAEPLEVIRGHWDAGGYRVEFETLSGGYPVAGEPSGVRFLIMEDVGSPRPPIEALSGVTIRCTMGSEQEIHDAVEGPAGTYSATHTFAEAGEATAQLELTGLDGNPDQVQVPLTVLGAQAAGH